MKIRMFAVCATLAFAAGTVAAQDAKKDTMSKDAMKPMTMQECKDYMAMAAKDTTKKDAKKDTMCADMMKKEEAPKK
jgi:pentapeptide MXKDX repeat protein